MGIALLCPVILSLKDDERQSNYLHAETTYFTLMKHKHESTRFQLRSFLAMCSLTLAMLKLEN